jgi:hypothetical protein
LTTADGKDLDAIDHTAVTNNFLHSLFSQFTVYLNGKPIKQSTQNYNYGETLDITLSYGSDAVHSLLTNAFCYRDTEDMLACGPTAAGAKNTGFVSRWNLRKNSMIIELYGRLHSERCNVTLFLLPGIRKQIKLMKLKPSFNLMKDRCRAFNRVQVSRCETVCQTNQDEPLNPNGPK